MSSVPPTRAWKQMPHGVTTGLALGWATSSSSPGNCFLANQPFLFSLYMNNSPSSFSTLPSHPPPLACIKPLFMHARVRHKPTRLLCPQGFPGKNTGVGSHFLLLTQGSNLHQPYAGGLIEKEPPTNEDHSLPCQAPY